LTLTVPDLFPQFLNFVTAGAIEKPGFSADFFDLTAKYVRISPVSGRFARLSRLLSLLVDRPFCKEK
jgi:hypothetical protein